MGAMLPLNGPVRAACPLLAAAVMVAVFAAGCGGKQETPPPQTSASTPAPGTPAEPGAAAQPGAPGETAQPAPYVPAPAVTQASWAPDALEELLAPIALYPDPLLTQVLAASVNSQEVLDGGNWLLQNESLKGQALDDAAAKAGFGPAMRSLVQFPQVVDMMCQQIDWTRQLGSAFSSDQKSVLDAVQRLRAEAAKVGNLESTPQQKVETKTENQKVIVEVKPADPKVVYVPQYDPQVIYTTPPPAQPAAATTATTTEKKEDTVSTGAAIAGGLLAFGLGVVIGNAFDDDDYYPNWGHGAVYYGPRPFYPPAYVYRPVYGPAFRPAYGYAPPAGYRNRYNSPTNIVINNNNYYNRFDNNRNLQANHPQSPIRVNQNDARVGQAGGGVQNRQVANAQNRVGNQGGVQNPALANRNNENWKGQSTYAGTRPDAVGGGTQQRVGGTQGAAGTRQASLSESQAAQRAQANRSSHVDRGYGESTRASNAGATARPDPAPRPDAASRPDPASRDRSASSDRAASVDRTGSAERTTRTAAGERDNAFSGAHTEGGGSFDRAASARGRASAGGGGDHARAGGGRRR
jgi:hypothetical protein